MKHLISVLAVALSSLAVSAHAADAASAPTKQQSKMTTCNAEAGDKKGDERKAFMKTCLSNKPVSAKAAAQQEKMKTCNKEAEGKKGDERKAFMKTCLSNKA
ncbi:MAG: phosphate starvation-inducible protein PsiF [Rhizobacter sp.]|nr:phosphate starvation-inducible protein PsiF [Rhizobacter sp.]